ncbi:hypothetical protein EJ06DRAFT_585352 [Trichodelitschia bisporula]|uniref:ER membrane protein complex subunit 10 n=1 Tax=Trichodelitschia bisporula TaxID=703511 RepID=A0A6G1HJ51_9PEZI|nr:hypothetical protein EJ06DRAFT_585352 [Trichodelitschia bisporula]
MLLLLTLTLSALAHALTLSAASTPLGTISLTPPHILLSNPQAASSLPSGPIPLSLSSCPSTIAVDTAALAPGVSKHLTLFSDAAGSIVGFGFAAGAPRSAVKNVEEEWMIELAPVVAGPQPVFNKPPVLAADGEEAVVEGDQRSFLQKYWWAIAIFLVLQLVMGGGGGE